MASAGQSTEQARQAQDVDAIPTLAWSARPDGSAEFLNRRWLDYTGLSAEEASDWGWTAALHTEDPLSGHPKPANEGHLKTGQRESPGH